MKSPTQPRVNERGVELGFIVLINVASLHSSLDSLACCLTFFIWYQVDATNTNVKKATLIPLSVIIPKLLVPSP